MNIESALVVLIPEANILLDEFRKRHDLPAADNLPAHVTTLYPFKNPAELTDELSQTLRRLFLSQPAFIVSFSEIKCFPDMLYLAPVPAEPFRRLTELVFRHFPDCPPYGGAFPEIIPHLTIAKASDDKALDEIAADFIKYAREALPIHAKVTRMTLIVHSGDCWQVREEIPLGAEAKFTTDKH